MKVTVIGGGSWGTGLAHHYARRGHDVLVWCREPEVAAGLNEGHRNPLFVRELDVHPGVRATAELDAAAAHSDRWLWVVPVQHSRSVLGRIAEHASERTILVSASKGLEHDSLQRMDQVVAECLKGTGVRFGALSGPTFAREVIHGRPSAAVLAGPDEPWRGELQRESSDEHLRLYTSSDIVGVELSGALKNVIAIAAGVAAGMELGPNAQSALITRGLHEITRLGMKAGADPETFRGLAGMGDLLLTCSSSQSRNYSVGRRLGQGERTESIVSGTQEVAEGVATADAAKLLAAHYGVEMPITDAVVRLLADEVSAKQVVRELMLRSLKTEAEL